MIFFTLSIGLGRPLFVLALFSGQLQNQPIDWLLADGDPVRMADAVAFTITGKILYIETPVAGTIFYNQSLRETPERVNQDPYTQGWLFRVQPEGDLEQACHVLATVQQYMHSLCTSEGFKNPEGIKGGVSGVCKAVYYGIGQQKI